MGIVKEDIQRIREDTDIVALMGEHTSLKRSGKNMMGLCVFHDERTPSMSISPDNGFYHCFGCGASGDAIKFVRQKIGMGFQDAVEYLASRMNYQLHYTSAQDTVVHANSKKQREVVKQAMEWYHKQLMESDSGGSARNYLKSRGYDKVIVEKWKLGWAPEGYNNLSKELNLNQVDLLEAQLVSKSGNSIGDFFRARLLFPIFNSSSEPIAFGGRILPDADGPKYINSRDSSIYKKGKELYGFHLAKNSIVKEDRAVVVEGYTDVIALENMGIKECVATCGTSLTEDHLRKLSHFSKNIVLVFDPDTAGSSAMVRTDDVVKMLEEIELEVRVVKIEGDDDPGDLAVKNPEAMAKFLDEAVPHLEYHLTKLFGEMSLDTNEEKYRASQRAGQLIADYFARAKKVSTSQLKEKYVNFVATRTQISAAAIMSDMKAAPVRKQGKEANSTNHIALPIKQNTTERSILLWAIHKPEEVPLWLHSSLFEFETEKNLFDGLATYETLSEVYENIPESSGRLLTELVVSEPPVGNVKDHLARIIFATAERVHKKMNQELEELIGQNSKSPEVYKKFKKIEPLKGKIDQVSEYRLKLDEGDYPVEDLLEWLEDEDLLN